MCEPIADGSRVFGPTTYYDTLPPGGYREAHGFDAAYTVKTTSDFTVTLTGRAIDGRLYLTSMLRHQAASHEYIPLMRHARVEHVHWYAASTERGLADLLHREGIRVTLLPTTTDKLARAIPAATAWNRGEILTPRSAPWAPALESEISQFTGHNDAHDDVIDALAALYHAVVKPGITDARTAASLYR
jgi:predicted phage terminase large subunit-like protein